MVGSTDDREIVRFADQVVALFTLTKGTWIIDNTEATSQETYNTNGIIMNGAGLHCEVRMASSAGELAVRALAIAGYPCERLPDQLNAPPPQGMLVDITIHIGSRIIPPK
jgi:hypothetical protein